MTELMKSLEKCVECQACLEVCPTYRVTRNEALSPLGRIKAAEKIFSGKEISPQVLESIYSCTGCQLCTNICPYDIDVPEIVDQSRVELAKRGLGPMEGHKEVIEGLERVGNPFNGDPSKRLDWMPEEFPTHESSTLLFIGCLPAYMVKDAALSSYLLLKKLGVDFMILKDEECCGIYYHEVGRLDLARERFKKNVERFKKSGIKRIITICIGCYHCFKRLYPELLGSTDFEVVHIVPLISSLLKEKGIKLKQNGVEVTYHDSCHMGRVEGFYDEPREVLRLCGVKVNELAENRENAPCCGAGGAVRRVYRDLSLNIAKGILEQAPVSPIVTCCPFCQFNFNYTAQKTGSDKKINYITEIVLQALK